MTFTWTNPDPQSGDTYAWAIVQGSNTDQSAQTVTTSDPTVTVNAQEGSQTCIQVSIVRKNRQMSVSPAIGLCGQAARMIRSATAGHATLALRIASDVRPAAAEFTKWTTGTAGIGTVKALSLHQQPEKTGVREFRWPHRPSHTIVADASARLCACLMPSGGHTWTVPVITLLLLLGLVAGAVIMSTVTRRHVQLDDGTVWVTSLKNQKAARFNVKNKEADAGVSSSAPRFDIAQHNGDTILTETTKASTIKASTVSTGVKTDIKANTTTVVGGDTAALINEKTGNVWTGLSENLDSVTPTTSDPKIKLGEGGRIAVTHDGKVYGYRPSDGMVLLS